MIIAVLDTGLFPDREGVLEALDDLEPHFSLYRREVGESLPSDDEWDQILDEILNADRVVVV